ncbi:MAG: DUF1501 domain-containing protein [Planctomycetes bacterium]|nr:DUF1501 domain-containing protein [Planctomycetota bacterium]
MTWSFGHPRVSRRAAIQAGAIGLLGLGSQHVSALRNAAAQSRTLPAQRSVIYIFLSGGLSQHDSFDMKPNAPDNIRGEFQPIATSTPGIEICEHLPQLALRSQHWSLIRSLTHRSNEHSTGHHIMLTGRSDLPVGFNPSAPRPADWPSIAAIAGAVTTPRNNLPPAAILPGRLVHDSRRVIPGQFAGIMGSHRDPWFIEASPFSHQSYGAYPEFEFDHQTRPNMPRRRTFQAPSLSLPEGLTFGRLDGRLSLLDTIERQRRELDRVSQSEPFDRFRDGALSLLTSQRVRQALDVTTANEEIQLRYGKNSFGWSLLMARRLVEAGVNLVQVNLGNSESWDTHGEAFPHLKNYLFPPSDRALSALVDDLHVSGLLESTLIVMAGEFGRTPKITHLPQFYKLPGRDHWGAVQSVWVAGGGIQGGRVIGSSDKMGAFPAADPQTPENFAATIYSAMGLPETVAWYDDLNRPHHIYHGEPIRGLT